MKKRTRSTSVPDITPLIDVVFLLLIFFMVSTVFKKDELALLLNLPRSSEASPKQKQRKNLVIELSGETMALNGKKVTAEEMDEQLNEIQDKNTPIDLRIDKDVKYSRIIELFDILKRKALTNLELVTDS